MRKRGSTRVNTYRLYITLEYTKATYMTTGRVYQPRRTFKRIIIVGSIAASDGRGTRFVKIWYAS